MIKASIIIIGDEILLGRVADTNTGDICRALDRAGILAAGVRTVGDDADAIRRAVTDALATSDVVITTGGLGPTKDDITKRVLTEIFGGETIRDASITANIEAIFAGRGLRLNGLTLDQALVPSSARIIQNRFGTAPIMVFERDGHRLYTMPGVPGEMRGMLPEVIEDIRLNTPGLAVTRHATRVVTGISESALAEHLDDFENSLPPSVSLAYLPDSPIIRLRLDGRCGEEEFADCVRRLDRELAGVEVLAYDDLSLGEIVLNEVGKRGLTLAAAESCTGGNIAHTITAVAGSSAVFNGGAVTYANEAKVDVLGVSAADIAAKGAVSEPVVRAMAEGACRVFHADCAVATSGIAGPGGGTDDKPVGTVWIAVRTPRGTVANRYRFPGDRARVIARATATALIDLLRRL